jgi:hypothetical protein
MLGAAFAIAKLAIVPAIRRREATEARLARIVYPSSTGPYLSSTCPSSTDLTFGAISL